MILFKNALAINPDSYFPNTFQVLFSMFRTCPIDDNDIFLSVSPTGVIRTRPVAQFIDTKPYPAVRATKGEQGFALQQFLQFITAYRSMRSIHIYHGNFHSSPFFRTNLPTRHARSAFCKCLYFKIHSQKVKKHSFRICDHAIIIMTQNAEKQNPEDDNVRRARQNNPKRLQGLGRTRYFLINSTGW